MDYNKRILEVRFINDGRGSLSDGKKSWPSRDPEELKGVCFHQSLEQYGTASGNAKYHMGPNHISKDGLPGLSYTLFVEKDGNIILANDVESKTYSQGSRGLEGDENAKYIGVCFGGNFSGPGYEGTQVPTTPQLQAAEVLWWHLASIWMWGPQCLFGHFDFGKPACPGHHLMDLIKSVRPPSFITVIEKQRFLMKMGFYRGDLDAVWGPASKAALVEFQRSAGIHHDGVWGRGTTRAAVEAYGG